MQEGYNEKVAAYKNDWLHTFTTFSLQRVQEFAERQLGTILKHVLPQLERRANETTGTLQVNFLKAVNLMQWYVRQLLGLMAAPEWNDVNKMRVRYATLLATESVQYCAIVDERVRLQFGNEFADLFR